MTVSPSPAPRARRLSSLTLAIAVALALGGCSASASGDGTAPSAPAPAAEALPTLSPAPAPTESDTPAVADDELVSDAPATEEPTDTPRTQAESCEWESAGLAVSAAAAPENQEGDLDTIIIGAWQHTHFIAGSGYEPLDDVDIRYVFPSRDRMLYCQHVPGITEYAENAADISWEDTGIVLPHGSVGYTVTSWDENSMVWQNHLDGSSYLLQRLQ